MSNSIETLIENMGQQVSISDFEVSYYQRDLAYVPPIMTKPLFNTKPDIVALPNSEEDLREFVNYAVKEKMPMIPRAGATTAYMNTVPVKGGMVIDLTRMNGIVDIDEENLMVEVWCGTPWLRLDRELNRKGFSLCSYPSSGVSATVGGWLNTEGYGVGSMRYGCFHDLIDSAHIYLPTGQEIDSSANSEYPLQWFVGKEGTLGIASRIKFRIRRKPEQEMHVALEIDSITTLNKIVAYLGAQEVVPDNIHIADQDCLLFQKQLGYEVPDISAFMLTITYQGNEQEIEQAQRDVNQIIADTAAKKMAPDIAQEEWDERLYALKIKRGGPSMLAAEVVLKLQNLQPFYQEIKKMKQRTAIYAHMMNHEYANVMVQYYADESKSLEYLFQMAKTKRIYDAAIKHGGRPYGTGIWNSVYNKRVHSAQTLTERMTIKQKLDPDGIMNPGKYYAPPALLNPTMFGLASGVANLTSDLFGIGKGR